MLLPSFTCILYLSQQWLGCDQTLLQWLSVRLSDSPPYKAHSGVKWIPPSFSHTVNISQCSQGIFLHPVPQCDLPFSSPCGSFSAKALDKQQGKVFAQLLSMFRIPANFLHSDFWALQNARDLPHCLRHWLGSKEYWVWKPWLKPALK